VIKLFIKHWIFEKCIDVFFDAIAKSFNKPIIDEILGIRNHRAGNKLIKTLTEKHNGELFTVRMEIPDNQIKELMKFHNFSEDELHNMFEEGLRQEARIEKQLRDDPHHFDDLSGIEFELKDTENESNVSLSESEKEELSELIKEHGIPDK